MEWSTVNFDAIQLHSIISSGPQRRSSSRIRTIGTLLVNYAACLWFFYIYIYFLFIYFLFLLLCNQVRAVPEGPPIAEKMENLAMALHKQPLRSCTKPKHGAQSRKWPIMLITKTSAAKHWSKFPKHRLTDNGYFEKKNEKQNQLKMKSINGKWAKQTYNFFCFDLFYFVFVFIYLFFFLKETRQHWNVSKQIFVVTILSFIRFGLFTSRIPVIRLIAT